MIPADLLEAKEAIEGLFIDIKQIIDDPESAFKDGLASEDLTNACIELFEKLAIDYNYEMVQQLLLLLIEKFEINQNDVWLTSGIAECFYTFVVCHR